MNLSPHSYAIVCLLLLFHVSAYAQRFSLEDNGLLIFVDDIRVEQVTPEGFHMYIRKKPLVESVLLTQNRWEIAYCTNEWNEVNGDEVRMIDGNPVMLGRESRAAPLRYPLIDSTAEPHADLGEAFHIYVPSTLYYDNQRVQVQAYGSGGLYINVQSFTLPYGDKQGKSQNNPFLLDLNPRNTSEDTVEEFVESESEEPEESVESVEEVVQPESGESVLLEEPVETGAEETPPAPEPEPEADPVITEVPELPLLVSPTEEVPRIFMPELRVHAGFTFFSPGTERILNAESSLDNKYDINGDIELKQRFSDLVSARLGFERDSLLMNRFFARGDFDFSLLSLSVGVFFGALNATEDTFPSGASLGLSARIFDFVVVFRVDIPLGDTLPSSYTQSYSAFNLDWYPSWAHLGLSLTGRTLFQKTAGSLDIMSKWVQYALFGEKSLGRFTPRLEFGYQELSWTFLVANSLEPAEYHYASLYLGLGTAFSLTETLSLNLHLQAPVYPFVYQALENSPLFFNATLGFSWNPLD